MPSPADIDRVAKALGSKPLGWQPVPGLGNQSARKFIVDMPHGIRTFVKIAANDDSAGWLRDEYRVYGAVHGPFMPAFRGWHDDGEAPVLALEDLSIDAHAAEPWTDQSVAAVLLSLSEVAAARPPKGTLGIKATADELKACWKLIGEDPKPFLALGICSKKWLEESLIELWTAAQHAPFEGDDLLHLDVRSDNLFIRDGWAILFDWNWSCTGNAVVDLAAWLPSLHAEGGPAPERLLTDDHGLAAALAGYFALHAAKPPHATFPGVRELQFKQLRSALPWATRSLGLSPPS